MQFDEKNHVYTKNNQNYTSVTTLLKQYGLSANYAGIPADVLQKAAARGTATHKAFENYIKSNGSIIPQAPDFGSIEVPQLQAYVINRSIDLTQSQSEQIVYDDTYCIAGTLDWTYYDNNEKILADFKTTSSIHTDAVSWQLSIYNYMLHQGDLIAYYTTKLMVFHFYQGKFAVKEVPLIEYQEVVNLLEAHKNGTSYTYTVNTSMILSDTESIVLSQLLHEIETHENLVKQLKVKYDTMIKPVAERMKLNKRDTVTINDIKFTLTGGSSRKTLDTALVKAYCIQNNIDVDQFYKISVVKEGLKTTLVK